MRATFQAPGTVKDPSEAGRMQHCVCPDPSKSLTNGLARWPALGTGHGRAPSVLLLGLPGGAHLEFGMSKNYFKKQATCCTRMWCAWHGETPWNSCMNDTLGLWLS